jgi:hypothetical protein
MIQPCTRHSFSTWKPATLAALAALTFAAPARSGGDDAISADTVHIRSIDAYVTAQDAGASGRKAACSMPPVLMSHRIHCDNKKIACITCHHRKGNDDRIKKCAQCHKGVAGLDIMHKKCGSCHRQRAMDMRCGSCHRDTVGRGLVQTMQSRDIRLAAVRFTHSVHLRYKPDCAACHRSTDADAWKQSGNFPKMAQCLECHDGGRAPKTCMTCHGDVRQIKPESHRRQWLARGGHGEQSLFDRKGCDQCHTARECDQCHRGQTAFRIHPAGYKFMHGIDARSGAANCAMCHESRLSCGKCHERKP